MESRSERLHGLDTLRAIAILSVMCFHTNGRLPSAFDGITRFGWMGVDLFFVLSGFLIGSQLLKPYAAGLHPSFLAFYLRRFCRVVPAFLTVLTVYFWIPVFREAPGISPAWYFLTFTENVRIDYAACPAFSHAWSLCVEEHFYLLLPALVFLIMRNQPRVGKTAAIVLGVLCFGMLARSLIFNYLVSPFHGMDDLAVLYVEKIYYPTYNRLDGLLIGIVIAAVRTFRTGWWDRVMSWANVLLGIGLLLIAGAISLFQDRFSSYGAVFGFPLLSIGLGFCTASAMNPKSIMGRRIFGGQAIATLAYSLYLTHLGTMHLDDHYFHRIVRAHSWALLILYVFTCFTAAATLYLLVERPFLQLRARTLRFWRWEDIERQFTFVRSGTWASTLTKRITRRSRLSPASVLEE